MNKIKIALVDDHDLFREGIKLVLSQIDNLEVVFSTSKGDDFLNFLRTNFVNVVLMDIEMPQINGIETTKKAILIKQDLKVIALTMFSDLNNFDKMIEAGAKGFILKSANKHELNYAINQVFEGKTFFSQQILQKMAFHKRQKSDIDKNTLTKRELEVLELVCKGYTSQEIADKIFISKKTVEVHRTNIFQKTQVRNLAELILWAIKNNFFHVE